MLNSLTGMKQEEFLKKLEQDKIVPKNILLTSYPDLTEEMYYIYQF